MIPQATVIIPHYNDLARLETCLAALAPQLAAHPEVDPLVVDNNSPVDMAPIQARYPGVRFVTETTKGAAAARNRGVAETTASILIFLDSDCVPAPDWLDMAIAASSRADLVGGRMDTFDETPPPRSGAEAFEAVFAFHQKTYIEKMGFSVTANLVTRRDVFDTTGPLIVGLSEDKDWCLRATAKGFSLIYADDMIAHHPTRQDWPALAKKWRRLTEEGFQLFGTALPGRLVWAVRGVAVFGSGFVHIPKVMQNKDLSGQEKIRGVLTLLRLRAVRMGWMIWQGLFGR